MRFAFLALLSAFAVGSLAAPSPEKYVLHEKRETRSSPWTRGERLHKRTSLPMRIGLTQSNLDKGHDLLMEVAHHESPRYGKHYTPEEVIEIFAPSKDTVNAVRAWLEAAGIQGERIVHSANKQWLAFEATVSEAENLLKTKYHAYEHRPSGRTQVGCDEYHLPSHVREHIDYIQPGIKLFAGSAKPSEWTMRKRSQHVRKNEIGKRIDGVSVGVHDPGRKPGLPIVRPLPPSMTVNKLVSAAGNSSELANCDLVITPACVKALYNITVGTTATPGNELGIFEDLADVYNQRDLDLFFQNLYPIIPEGTHPVNSPIDGAVVPNPDIATAGPESDLDIQISYPIIWPQNSVLFQTDDPVYEANYTFQGFLNNFFDAIDGSYCTFEGGNSPLDPPYPDPAPGGYKGELQCGVYTPTNVISISYGGSEFDLPVSYLRRQCTEVMKLGLQGITVVASSGDDGVAGFPGDPTPNGCLLDGSVFNPQFPADCPYVATIGATFLPEGADVTKDEEVAVTRFPSGGGFSNVYTVADDSPWQTDAISNYFATSDPGYPYYETANNESIGANGGIYNRAGSGIPDFGANGDGAFIFTEGQPALIGGTSESAPIFAAILTRVNEERLAAGKSTVGFVQPLLYAHPEVFHDITVGNNPGCGTDGFPVAAGWDPVTGLGTPNYPQLLDLFLAQP